MLDKLKGLLTLVRPGNCLGAGLAAGLGAFLAGMSGKQDKAALAMGVVTLVTAFGNAVNDLYDVETDRVNMPHRPLVSGAVTRAEAVALTVMTAASGLALSLLINATAAWVAAATVALLWLYSAELKGMVLIGNLIVSVLGALSLMYGAIAVERPFAVLGAALVFALLMLAREILKCVEDYEGDLRADLRTIAVVIGPEPSLRIFAALTLVSIAAVPLYLVSTATAPSVLVGSLLVSLMLAATLYFAGRPSPRNLRRGVKLTKTSFYVGMLMLFLSQVAR